MADNVTKILLTAEDRTRGAFDSVTRGLAQVEGAAAGLNDLASRLPGIGAALSAALGAVSFTAIARGAIDAADGLNDLSQKIGVGVKELSGYQLIAEQSGATLETVGKGVRALANYITDSGEKLRAAGITATDTQGAMRQLADLFASLPDGIQKTALATEIFGKAGVDLIPLLNQGSRGIAEAQEKAESYGEAMERLAPNADRFNDLISELGVQAKESAASIVSDLLPAINKMLERMVRAKREVGTNWLESFFVGIRGLDSDASLTEMRERAATLQMRISDNPASNPNARLGFVFTSRLAADRAELAELQRQIEARLRESQNFGRPLDAASEKSRFNPEAILGKKAKDDKDSKTASRSSFDMQRDSLQRYLAELDALNAKGEQLSQGERLWITVTEKLTAAETARLEPLRAQIIAEEAIAKARDQDKASDAARLRIDSLEQDFARDNATRAASLGVVSESARELEAALRGVDDKAARLRDEFDKAVRDGKITTDARIASIDELNAAVERQRKIVIALATEQERLNGAWEAGASRALQSYIDEVSNVARSTEQAMTGAFRSMEDAMVEFATTGKLSFTSLAESIIRDMVRIQIQQSITKPLAEAGMSWLGSLWSGFSMSPGFVGPPSSLAGPLPSANGNVFASADLHRYANTIVSSPTLFKFANGGAFRTGLMGEAGPEAIMPLTRINGQLGVRAEGAGANVIVNVIEAPGQGGKTASRTAENGTRTLDIFVEQIKQSVAADISRGSGPIPAALSGAFGLNRVAGVY